MSNRPSTGPIVVAITAAAVGALIFCVSLSNSEHRPAPNARPRPSSTAAVPDAGPVVRESEDELRYRIVERTQRERTAYDRVLSAAVAGDPRGEELLAFYRAHAWFGFFLSDGELVSADRGAFDNDPMAFEVNVASMAEREANGVTSPSPWSWSGEHNRLLMLPASDHTNIWIGAIVAHELSHAHDALTGVEPRGLPWEDQRFLDGELRAYALTFRLLERATGGRLRHEADALVAQFAEVAGSDGILMLNAEPLAPLDALFPFAESMPELGARMASYRIYLNLLLADVRGDDLDWRRNMVLNIMRLGEG